MVVVLVTVALRRKDFLGKCGLPPVPLIANCNLVLELSSVGMKHKNLLVCLQQVAGPTRCTKKLSVRILHFL